MWNMDMKKLFLEGETAYLCLEDTIMILYGVYVIWWN